MIRGRRISRLLTATLIACSSTAAAIEVDSFKVEAQLWAAASLDDLSSQLARLSVTPELELRFGSDWHGAAALRLEYADDAVGLGRTAAFAAASKPWRLSEQARIEVDALSIEYRGSQTTLTLGKQVVAWGVLDGLQVTDRFAPVRRRDFVLLDPRPDRISRWGARLRHRAGALLVDAAVAFDPTSSQLPEHDGAFAPPVSANLLRLPVARRGHEPGNATYGLRLARQLDRMQVSVLALSGPDTDAVVAPAPAGSATPAVLDHPRRTLLGSTLEASAGELVLRLEVAHVPDQPTTAFDAGQPVVTTRARTLAGVGVDWSAPAGIFVNAQLGVDHLQGGGRFGLRSRTDTVATLRGQRGLRQDTLVASAELLISLDERDGAFRPALRWQVDDNWSLATGADLLFGARETPFGQFRDRSRFWLRATVSM
jgi:hypothetical protein